MNKQIISYYFKPGKVYLFSIILSFFTLFNTHFYSQDAEFTQFYSNPIYLNPALTGTHMCPRVSMNYRNQWPGISGTFVTSAFSYDQHVSSLHGGLGLMFVNDQASNSLVNTRISGIYSYQMKVSRKFSIRTGFEATYWQKSLDWNQLTFGDMIDPIRGFVYQTQDIPRGGTVGGLDLSAGIVGFSEQFYIGFAAHHLTEPDESMLSNNSSPIPRKYTGHIGAMIPLAGKASKYETEEAFISPNILYRRQGSFQQINMGIYLSKGPLVGGVWYRNQDAFILLVGMQMGQVKFGYSYDVTVSKLSMATSGSHELSLQLNFVCEPKKRTYRTISCPSF
ncbi:MAG: type IX secretion system membrane protein PorP/SprF [Flavobacteriales bacterium]|nr:type IX secretion system membrane protein PorP/SprF [Flavobacteriales bacterium]